MLLGIPKGHFYYDYMIFIQELFKGTSIETVTDIDNDSQIYERGSRITVDEACMPIKLFIGQADALRDRCDKVLIVRNMKDMGGRWLCPKLLGLPELSAGMEDKEKFIITEPVYFNNERKTRRCFWNVCRKLKMGKKKFEENFKEAYKKQRGAYTGLTAFHTEAAWEFTPDKPLPGEIILPNTKKVLLTGHCYNIYDKFSNGDIMRKLDELGIEAVTGKNVTQAQREKEVELAGFVKKPFWEAFVRIFGIVMSMKNSVDGVIYLSSFSCGIDAFIIETLKLHIGEIPFLVLKIDEHKAEAGTETRLEAFSDLLERRAVQ